MNFLPIGDLEIKIDLSILRRISQRHSVLLYQHEGLIYADNTRIGNRNNVNTEFELFFEKSRLTRCDLTLTPEYSCPLIVIEDIISHPHKWPAAEKLWAIGCESMTKQQLKALQTNHNTENIYVHFDTSVLENQHNYVDPLIYLFRGIHCGHEKLIVLLQFKTIHMGIWGGGIVERDNLIQGNQIYILRNCPDSISFFSLICSEAMNFPEAMQQNQQAIQGWIDCPFLIYNPQLNPDPTHQNFTDFRKFVFRFSKKEIISLNWNNKSKIGDADFMKYKTSRSGFYIQSEEIDLSPARIKKNHMRGMYYFFYGIKKHAFLLNSTPTVFHVAIPPVDIIYALNQQIRREGPELLETCDFNAARNAIETLPNEISDQHVNYLTGVGCTCNFLITHQNCILEKEKLVCLTSGKIDKELGSTWSNIPNIFSIKINEDSEVNRRITFTEDTYPDSLAQRSNYIDTIAVLNDYVLPDKDVYPDSIADLKTDELVIGYNADSNADNYKFNVLTITGERRIATICFIGTMPDGVIEKTFDFLQAMFDKDNNHKRRVVVFYKRGNTILSKYDLNAGNIAVTSDFEGPTFLK
ncbi:MAG: hypothetical protein CVT93_00805 [Bacteroidetes bacterium HGW-Bacteroidetes-10]|nr:MAG: hypothetical protein CVT93_00805 [Bacteroidetes bacterium HGW-Bacteroidetes-10]